MGVHTRRILADNLARLMAETPSLSTVRALATAAKQGTGNIDRLRRAETPFNLDGLDAVATAFGLSAWQLLVPNLDPRSAPVLSSMSAREIDAYKRLREDAAALIRASAPPPGGRENT